MLRWLEVWEELNDTIKADTIRRIFCANCTQKTGRFYTNGRIIRLMDGVDGERWGVSE